jgi:hypothetical protein
MLGRLGIRAIFYLDVILVLGSSYQFCLSNTQVALSILMKAGFLIIWEKSSLIPTTNFLFLGMLWVLVGGGCSPFLRTSWGVFEPEPPFSFSSLPQCASKSWS